MRASCEIIVRVDIAAAIAAGMVRACPKRERECGQEWGSERDRNRERRERVRGGSHARLDPPLNSPTPTYTQVFYESANGVLLSEGFDGVIPPRFFSGAEDRRTGKALSLDADGDAGGVDGVRGGGGTPAT